VTFKIVSWALIRTLVPGGTIMRKYIITWSYWAGTVCAAMALLTRSLDMLGLNFFDFNTRGSGIGYHSLMDGTLFFYAISAGNACYEWFISREAAGDRVQDGHARTDGQSPGTGASREVLSNTET